MSPAANGVTKPRKLMVVDDDEISLSVISLLLQSEGHEILHASGGAAAVDLLSKLSPGELPSAILADLRMPGLSGHDLAAAFRRLAPQAKLLAMSATPSSAAGYDAFINKPLDVASLRAALDNQSDAPEKTSTATGQQPVLDEVIYAKMTNMMPAHAVREVYEACVNDVRTRGLELRAAGEVKDLPFVRRTAHTFKGSAGMIGAKKLASAAAELELGSYRPEDVPEMIDNLLSCCDELHRILLTKL